MPLPCACIIFTIHILLLSLLIRGHTIPSFPFVTVSRCLSSGYNSKRPPILQTRNIQLVLLFRLVYFLNLIPPPLPCNISKLLFFFQKHLVERIAHFTGLMILIPLHLHSHLVQILVISQIIFHFSLIA